MLCLFTAQYAVGLTPLHRWLAAGIGLALLAAFALRERQQTQPLILPEVQGSRALQLLLGAGW